MIEQGRTKWPVILKHYAGVVSVAAVLLLLAVVVPVVGVVVCCSRCAGNTTSLDSTRLAPICSYRRAPPASSRMAAVLRYSRA